MTLWLELRCSGPAHPSNGCPEGYGEHGLGQVFADSHAALKDGYAALLADAERQGWKRHSKDLAMRCPNCAASIEASHPVEVAGIAWAKWDEALRRYEGGEFPSAWGGKDGLPTALQFRQAIRRYPEMLARVKASAIYKALPEEKAGPVEETRWEQVLQRYEAGEEKKAICTGHEGWPSIGQWNRRRKQDEAFRTRTDAVAADSKRSRAARARAAKPPAQGRAHKRLDPTIKAARAEARCAGIAERKRLAAEAHNLIRAEKERERLRLQAERVQERRLRREERERVKAERERLAAEARNLARAEKERERLRLQAERAQERERRRAERKAKRPKRQPFRSFGASGIVRRAKRRAAPPELKFDNRLSPANAEGCRFFCGPVPQRVDIGGGKSMKTAAAALFFAGKAVPKGCVIEHTCWNDDCFAADHLNPTPFEWRKPAPKQIGADVLERVAAIVSRQFGVDRADLTATVDRERGTKHVAFVRHVFRYLLSVELEFTASMVADSTGCDRTTVGYGNKVIEDRRDDAAFDRLLDELAAQARDYARNQAIPQNAANSSAALT